MQRFVREFLPHRERDALRFDTQTGTELAQGTQADTRVMA
jgi:hypothetical protein